MTNYPPKFEAFWKAYPRKVAKPSAAKAWEKQGMEDDMYAGEAAKNDTEKRIRHNWFSRDKTKIPHPATWINARRWEDEGWEDECGNDDNHTPVTTQYKQPPKPEREMPWYEKMLNRLGKNYILLSGGLPETDRALNIKKKIMSDDIPGFLHDIKAEQIDIREAGIEIGKLFLNHLDHAYQLKLADRVFKYSLLQGTKS